MIDLLQIDYQDGNVVVPANAPLRFSWRALTEQRNYRVRIFDAAGNRLYVDSGVTAGCTNSWVCPGGTLISDTAYRWQVTLNDGEFTARSEFRTAPQFSDGKWITEPAGWEKRHDRVVVFRKDFELSELPQDGYLHITALGLYRAEINGIRVGESFMTPGWTDYFHRVPYQSFDVTGLLHLGNNRIEIVLAGGWFCSRIATMWLEPEETYGDTPALRLELRGTIAGKRELITGSDETYAVTGDCEFVASDIYDGETIDYSRCRKNFQPCTVAERKIELFPNPMPEVRTIRRIAPVSVRKWSDDRYIVDFGVNLTGKEELRLKLAPGQTVTVTHAEVLDDNGDVYTANLRSAQASSTFAGDGTERTMAVEFTFFGFRYIAVEGVNGFTADMVTALQMHTPMRSSGSFRCSNELLNQLYANIINGQRCNYLDVPTDCPQRDERRAWLGDAQVFLPAAAFNFDVAAFMRRWLVDVDLGCNEHGDYPPYAPYHSSRKQFRAGAGWADAGIICPAGLYLYYGDTEFLTAHYEAMHRYMMRQLETADNFIRCVDIYRDWLNLGADTPPELLCTAYFAWDAKLMSKIARVLGNTGDARFFAELYENICAAYRDKFINAKGQLAVVTQTAAVVSLEFGLLRGKDAETAAQMLRNDVVNNRAMHLSTGFLGTPRLLHALAANGYLDIAYKLLEQTTYPSWLYQVLHGATTMWERWNSWAEFDGLADSSMNSFNHYAYGAVGEFLFNCVGGIAPVWEYPGMEKVLIAPRPGGTLTFAETEYDSRRGKISSSWYREDGKTVYRITIPPNTVGIIDIEGMEQIEVPGGEYEYVIKTKGEK